MEQKGRWAKLVLEDQRRIRHETDTQRINIKLTNHAKVTEEEILYRKAVLRKGFSKKVDKFFE